MVFASDVPTMVESGCPGFVSDTFSALLAPAKTPQDIIDRLVKETHAAMRTDEARQQAQSAGFQIVAGTPDQLAKKITDEIPAVKELIARIGIKPK